MKSVKVNRQNLLDVLRTNRETHIAEYQSAMIEYRKDVIAQMKENLKIAESGGEIATYITLEVPSCYESSYNTVIKMLEMDVEDIVELTMIEFQQYVEDNWNWKGAFAATASFYNAKAAVK
jgi:hypothetical protein